MDRTRFWSSRAASALLSVALVVSVSGPARALTYGPIVPVTSGVDVHEGSTALAAGAGVAHAEYQTVDNDLNPTGVLYKRSTDGGASWTGQAELVDAAHAPDTQAWGLAASGQLVVALFTRSETGNLRRLYIRRSTDAGAHWSDVQTIASFTSASYAMGFASIAASGQLVVVGWSDNRANTLRLRRSIDAGASFKPAIKIASYTGYDASPEVAVSGTRVYMTWVAHNSSGEVQVRAGLKLRRSTDSGATFKPAQTLVSGDLGYGLISLAASGKRFVALYLMPNRTLKVARSADGGATLTSSTIASGNPTTSYRTAGSIAINGLQVRVAWQELNHAYSRSSGDGGASWAAADEPFGVELYASSARIVLLGSATIVIAYIGSDTTIDVKSRAT